MTVLELLGCPLGIDADDAVVAAVLATLPPLPAVPQDVPPLRTWHVVPTEDGLRVLEETTDLGVWPGNDAVRVLGSSMEIFAAEHSPGLVVVHAGVVTVDGRAILVPGRTLAGKSTLIAALLGAGATYYSDEFAVLRPDGSVLPYPRPLSLRPGWAGSPVGGGLVTAAALGAGTGEVPTAVALVARLGYREGPPLAAAALSPGQTTLALVDNAVAARSRSAEVLATTALVAERCSGLDGWRGDADQAATALIALVRQD